MASLVGPDVDNSAEFLSRVDFVRRVDTALTPFENGLNAIGYLHIAHLKRYNRIHGIESGDHIMRLIAELLKSLVVDGLMGRYAGDGFTFVVPASQLEDVVNRINALLGPDTDGSSLQGKVGAIVCHRPLSCSDCVERARFAYKQIEDSATDIFRLFDDELEEVFVKRTYVVDHLDDAIAAGEITAWAQPIVRVLTGRICEVEILTRWDSKEYGLMFPDEFIPQLEHHALIYKLDLEVIRLACEQWSEARDAGINVPFGINLSRLDFELCDIYARVREIMARYGVPVNQMHIEVTESSAAHDESVVVEGVRRFRESGFSVYMDDFGSGYSSLGAMANLEFDVVKVDKTLIDHIEDDERARSVLADTVSMVKRLGIQTLCEGVETREQLDFLHAIGCEKAQGFYFSKPIPHDQIMGRLELERSQHERSSDEHYYDAVGQVNMLDGTSAAMHGIEAATFFGRYPIAILEFNDKGIDLLTCNIAYRRLLSDMGFRDLPSFVEYTSRGIGRVHTRAVEAAYKAKETGREQDFSFLVNNVYCDASFRFIAQSQGREAYLNMVKTVQNSPLLSEHTLLSGVLEGADRNLFWKDTNRRFLGANSAFLEYYGFSDVGDILGRTDEEMGWHVDDEPFRDYELRVLKGETISNARGICRCRGELRDIIATKRPLYSNGVIVGLVGYFEDIGPHEG